MPEDTQLVVVEVGVKYQIGSQKWALSAVLSPRSSFWGYRNEINSSWRGRW